MDAEKAALLEKQLTFDTTSPPSWKGMEGKCWVDLQSEKITVVGWMSDMGSTINNYRLVVQYKQRATKTGITQWIELIGYDDSNKEIKKKVYGTSMADALDVMLKMTLIDTQSVNTLAAAVANLCTVKRSDLHFGQPDTEGRHDNFPEPEKRTPPIGRPASVGGKRVQVYLDDESIRIAKELGQENVSEGIRLALTAASIQPRG